MTEGRKDRHKDRHTGGTERRTEGRAEEINSRRAERKERRTDIKTYTQKGSKEEQMVEQKDGRTIPMYCQIDTQKGR